MTLSWETLKSSLTTLKTPLSWGSNLTGALPGKPVWYDLLSWTMSCISSVQVHDDSQPSVVQHYTVYLHLNKLRPCTTKHWAWEPHHYGGHSLAKVSHSAWFIDSILSWEHTECGWLFTHCCNLKYSQIAGTWCSLYDLSPVRKCQSWILACNRVQNVSTVQLCLLQNYLLWTCSDLKYYYVTYYLKKLNQSNM